MHRSLILHQLGESQQLLTHFLLVFFDLLIDPQAIDLYKLLHLGVLGLQVGQFLLGLLQILQEVALDLFHLVDLPLVFLLLEHDAIVVKLRLLQLFLLESEVLVDLVLQLGVHILQALLILLAT